MERRSDNGTAYALSGPADGPLVVLIHGLGLNRGCWQWHMPALTARARVLTYDLYGHGDSAAPPAKPSLSLFAAQLRELLDELQVEASALVGFSLGGMINRRFAIDHPERVAALAILNSPNERGPEAQRLVEERAAQSAAGGPAATLDATIERWFTAAFRSGRPEVIALVRDWVLANDPASYAQCREVLAKGVTELVRSHPPIDRPTLVMTAEHDSGSTPAMSRAIAAEIPGARFLIVPSLQHMGLVEAPDLFTEPVLDFLDETGFLSR
ncbi:MAG: alpha/beta fold hydrolase [Pseudomonadota bacterium]